MKDRLLASLPLVVYGLLMVVLVRLGLWQWDKWQWQEARQARFADVTAAVPIAATDVSFSDHQFAPATTDGRFDTSRQFLIDNIVRNGRNGFFVITPFLLESGAILMVNRGWIAQTPSRQPMSPLTVPTDRRPILGRVGKLPTPGLTLGVPEPPDEGWPKVLQYPSLATLEEELQQAVLPWVLLLDADAADGYDRVWQPAGLPAERHLGYAVQWFALALALTLLMMAWYVRRRRHND
ncbi:MAG: SURF1 family protein [Pseudomonadota bacterium]